MKIILMVSIFIPLIVIPISSYGESPSLFIGGVELKLGMTKKEVKEIFATKNTGYKMQNLGNNAFSIVSKKGPPYERPGNFSFNNQGKLFWIGKDWGNYVSSDAYFFGRALYNCFLNQQQPSIITFQTQMHSQPDDTAYDLTISWPNGKQIIISTSENKKYGNQVSIVEGLSSF